MKIKYKGETSFLIATKGKIMMFLLKRLVSLMDDSGEDYLYPPEMFER